MGCCVSEVCSEIFAVGETASAGSAVVIANGVSRGCTSVLSGGVPDMGSSAGDGTFIFLAPPSAEVRVASAVKLLLTDVVRWEI